MFCICNVEESALRYHSLRLVVWGSKVEGGGNDLSCECEFEKSVKHAKVEK